MCFASFFEPEFSILVWQYKESTVFGKTVKKETILGPEHEHYIQFDQFPGTLNSQRDIIGNEWVLNRAMKRIQLAADEKI